MTKSDKALHLQDYQVCATSTLPGVAAQLWGGSFAAAPRAAWGQTKSGNDSRSLLNCFDHDEFSVRTVSVKRFPWLRREAARAGRVSQDVDNIIISCFRICFSLSLWFDDKEICITIVLF